MNNIAPNVSDLRVEDLKLRVLRGFEQANRVDKKLSGSFSVARGEYVAMNNDGTVSAVTATPAKSLLVFRGTEGYDQAATSQVTTFQHATSLIYKTDNYVAGSYNVSDKMVAVLAGGVSTLRKAANATEKAFAVAEVSEVGDGFLVLELL